MLFWYLHKKCRIRLWYGSPRLPVRQMPQNLPPERALSQKVHSLLIPSRPQHPPSRLRHQHSRPQHLLSLQQHLPSRPRRPRSLQPSLPRRRQQLLQQRPPRSPLQHRQQHPPSLTAVPPVIPGRLTNFRLPELYDPKGSAHRRQRNAEIGKRILTILLALRQGGLSQLCWQHSRGERCVRGILILRMSGFD